MSDEPHRVTAVGDSTKDWKSQHGKEYRDYKIQLDKLEGWHTLTQVPATKAPAVGDDLFGHAEPTDYGPKFRKAQQNTFSGGGAGGKSPEQQKAIVRQHSQEMALRWMTIQSARGKVPDEFGYEQLKPVIDWFVEDAG